MRLNDVRLWCRLLFLLIVTLLAVCLLSGCKTKYIPVEKTVYRDITKCDTLLKHDSIHVHDSVVTYLKGDTVYKDRLHKETILKNIYRTRIDSFVERDTIPVPYPIEKELSRWQQFQLKYAAWAFGALCMVILYLLYKLYKKIRNARNRIVNNEK